MLVLAAILPLTSPSSVFAKRDNEPANSVSEQLQHRNADGGNWNGVEEFVPERANVYSTEKKIEKHSWWRLHFAERLWEWEGEIKVI